MAERVTVVDSILNRGGRGNVSGASDVLPDARGRSERFRASTTRIDPTGTLSVAPAGVPHPAVQALFDSKAGAPRMAEAVAQRLLDLTKERLHRRRVEHAAVANRGRTVPAVQPVELERARMDLSGIGARAALHLPGGFAVVGALEQSGARCSTWPRSDRRSWRNGRWTCWR
jgi:hypothetical protein